jgi:hypothetical protein
MAQVFDQCCDECGSEDEVYEAGDGYICNDCFEDTSGMPDDSIPDYFDSNGY